MRHSGQPNNYAGPAMIRRKNRRLPVSPVAELNNLLTSPVPSEVIAELSTPVLRALLLDFVMKARYGE